MNIANLREEYRRASLDETAVTHDPFEQFTRWFDEAVKSEHPALNAMTLATVSAEGRPSARIVLLKGVDHGGFVFYTNYKSRKGRELTANPAASLVMFWHQLEREVRVDGRVKKITAAESDAYFSSRPLGSRHAAIASPQSEVVASRSVLQANEAEFKAKFGDNPPRPPHWGGYRLKPDSWQFWQGRRSRLHDRLRYTLQGDGGWLRERLAP